MQTSLINFTVMDDVKMRLVDGENIALAWISTHWRCPVNPSHSDAISGLNFINEVIVGKDAHCVGRLTRWHVLCK